MASGGPVRLIAFLMLSHSPCKSFCAAWAAGAAALLVSVAFLSSAVAQVAPAAPAPDRAHIEEVLRGLSRGRVVGQVAVSPDGRRLAWIEGARGGGEILVAPLDDLKKSERVTAAAKPDERCHEGEIAWQPDSKALAFFSDCASPNEQSDLYIARLDGTPARRVTELKGYVKAPAFSPDGTQDRLLVCGGSDAAFRRTGGHEASVGGDWRG